MINNLNEIARMWADWCGLLTLQNTIFLVLVFAVLFAFRNVPAKYLHLLGVLGLTKLLLPPFLPGYFLTPEPVSQKLIPAISIGGILPVNGVSAKGEDISITGIIFLIWLVTALGYLGLVFGRTFLLKSKLYQTSTRHFEPQIPDSVRLFRTSVISSPLSLGIFSPKIYLPEDWLKLSPECRKMMLAHEMAHLRRFDGLTNVLQIIVRAIYLFHPLVWLLGRLLDQYREMACDDDAVAAAKLTPLAFSRYLVQYAEQVAFPRLGYVSASALIRRKKQLFNRVNYQMKEAKMQYYSRIKITGLILLLLLLMVPFSWYKTESVAAPTDAPALGKIYGMVTDKESGKPLAGVNVVLQGTKMGAATDKNGKFFILNVPVGVYPVEFSFIGYKSVVLRDVRVAARKSTEVNSKLEQTIMELSELKNTDVPPPPPKPLKEGQRLVAPPKPQENEQRIDKEIPPKPPLPDSNWVAVRTDFVAFDVAPKPVGGYAAITGNIQYPEIARKYQLYGTVLVKMLINAQGKVAQAEVHSNSKIKTKIESGIDANSGVTQENLHSARQVLEMNVIKAIQESKWEPARQREQKVPVWIMIPVKFDLREDAKQ